MSRALRSSRVRDACAAVAAALLFVACAHTAPTAGSPEPDPDPGPVEAPPSPAEALAASDALFGDDFDDELEDTLAPEIHDPLEPVNRGIFSGNRVLDRFLIDPITRAYGFVVPDPAKRAVRGVFSNLNEPVVIVNDLLQLEGHRAATASGRFVLNSTVGLAGIWDPAARLGLERHEADFGQTLGKAGVGPGFYLVLPLLGPSTARDAVGGLVDFALRPDTWLLPVAPRIMLGSGSGLAQKEHALEKLEALESSSIDYYVALRGAYWMQREAFVRDEPRRITSEVEAEDVERSSHWMPSPEAPAP